MGYPASCWRGAWGSPDVGTKIASCRSLKRLLGFAGHSDQSFSFASAVPGPFLGRLLSLRLSGPLQPFPRVRLTACSEHRSVPDTVHPPSPRVYHQEQPGPGARPGGYHGRSSRTNFVLDHPPLCRAASEPPYLQPGQPNSTSVLGQINTNASLREQWPGGCSAPCSIWQARGHLLWLPHF